MLLGETIRKCIAAREPVDELAQALLNSSRDKVRIRQEGDLWDYKQHIDLANAKSRANIAKDVLAFHNAQGGCIIIGVDNQFRICGVEEAHRFDEVRLRQAIGPYVGRSVEFFVAQVLAEHERQLIVIFIPRRRSAPVAAQCNGPDDRPGQPCFRERDYFIRDHDQSRLVQNAYDYCLLFNGFSPQDASAYACEVDRQNVRLLRPHCTRFVGRSQTLAKLARTMERANPHVMLIGHGGIGKSEVAIAYAKACYQTGGFDFIVSMSAKHVIWADGGDVSARADFSGLPELTQILKEVLLPDMDPLVPQQLREEALLKHIHARKGLIVLDNLESVRDPKLFEFLTRIEHNTKVLATSRVDSSLGALPVEVEAMTSSESRELMEWEFDKVGVDYSPKQLDNALSVGGGQPLAIKTIAQLSAIESSVEAALVSFADHERSFVAFCLEGMFDRLSSVASQVALLHAYLGGDSWTVENLSLALGVSDEAIRDALFDLQEKGLLLPGSLLPGRTPILTPPCISLVQSRWNSESRLKQRVEVALGRALGEYASTGLFTALSREVRASALLATGRKAGMEGRFADAIRYLRCALSTCQNNLHVQFELGRYQLLAEQRESGFFNLWYAYERMTPPRVPEYSTFVAEAFLGRTEVHEQSRGIRALAQLMIDHPHLLSSAQAEMIVRRSLEIRDLDLLAWGLGLVRVGSLQPDIRKKLADEIESLVALEMPEEIRHSLLGALIKLRTR